MAMAGNDHLLLHLRPVRDATFDLHSSDLKFPTKWFGPPR